MRSTAYEIKETILVLPKEKETDVYHKELNLVSWYGKPEKYDIRGWSEEQGCRKHGRGISLSEEEFRELISIGEDLLY